MFYIEKEKIVLREFMLDDVDNKVEWINDERNNRHLHYDIPICREKTIEWYKNKSKNRIDCVIEYENISVGLIGLIDIDKNNQKAEFYISMGRHDFKRKGIATKATKMLLEYSFEVLNLNKIYLNVDEENEAACRLYEKIGFQLEGRFIKDMVHRGNLINRLRYSMLKENFRGDF